MRINFWMALLGLLISSVSFGDQTPAMNECQLGCDASAQCESLVDMTKYQLWSVGVVTANPHPGNYQIESYGIEGTPNSPGHLIFITYGYVDSKNPGGGCEIQMIDGVAIAPAN